MYYLRIAAIGSSLAGLSHLTLQAYSHFGIHFYFIGFLFVGLAQIILGVLLWKGPLSRPLFCITVLINGGATVFWLLTRVMVAPFMGGVEHFTVIGVTVVTLQLASLIAVCLKRSNFILSSIAIISSIGVGFAAHFGAMQLEHHVPQLKGSGNHHHSSKHLSDELEDASTNDHHNGATEHSPSASNAEHQIPDDTGQQVKEIPSPDLIKVAQPAGDISILPANSTSRRSVDHNDEHAGDHH